MKKDYQSIVDEIFGGFYQHRTLRTIFDPYSNEWTDTNLDKKIEILTKIINSKKINMQQLILGYKFYYLNEITNKKYAIDSIDEALAIILQKVLLK